MADIFADLTGTTPAAPIVAPPTTQQLLAQQQTSGTAPLNTQQLLALQQQRQQAAAPPPAPVDPAVAAKQQEYADNQTLANSGVIGAGEAGFEGGLTGLDAGYHGLLGKAQAALGFKDAGTKSLRRSQELQQDAASYVPTGAGSFADARKSGNWGKYIASTVGGALPGVAATVGVGLATGGLGDLAGGALAAGDGLLGDAATSAAGRAVAKAGVDMAGAATEGGVTPGMEAAAGKLGVKLGANATGDDATAAIAKQLGKNMGHTVGEQAGVVGAGALMSADSNVNDVLKDPGDGSTLQQRALKGIVGDLGSGAAMALPGLAMMHRFGLGAVAEDAVAKSVPKSVMLSMLKEGGEQAGLGAAGAGATAVINGAVHNWITNQHNSLVSSDAMASYLNSAASGAVGGAALGSLAGIHAPEFAENHSALSGKIGKVLRGLKKNGPQPGGEILPGGGTEPPPPGAPEQEVGLNGAPPAAAGADTTASVPFMITQAMKARLRAGGYSDNTIAAMHPQTAHDAISMLDAEPTAGSGAAPGSPIQLDKTDDVSDAFADAKDAIVNSPQRIAASIASEEKGVAEPYDTQPVDPNDPTGALQIGTSSVVPGRNAIDPKRMSTLWRLLGPKQNMDDVSLTGPERAATGVQPGDEPRAPQPFVLRSKLDAAAASMLPDDQLAAHNMGPVKAYADALQHGFNQLPEATQHGVGKFLDLLGPDGQNRASPAWRLLTTTDNLARDGELHKLQLGYKNDAPGMPGDELQTASAADSKTGVAGGLTEHDEPAEPTTPGYLSPADWSQARYYARDGAGPRDPDAQVHSHEPIVGKKDDPTGALSDHYAGIVQSLKDGTPSDDAVNAPAALTAGIKDPLTGDAVHGALHAAMHAEGGPQPVHPDMIRSVSRAEPEVAKHLRVYNREVAHANGNPDTRVVSHSMTQLAAAMSKRGDIPGATERERSRNAVLMAAHEARARGRPLTKGSIREGLKVFPDAPPLDASDVKYIRDQWNKRGSEKTAPIDRTVDVGARATTFREAPTGFAEGARTDRQHLGEGDFSEGADAKLGPRANPGVGTGEQMVHGDAKLSDVTPPSGKTDVGKEYNAQKDHIRQQVKSGKLSVDEGRAQMSALDEKTLTEGSHTDLKETGAAPSKMDRKADIQRVYDAAGDLGILPARVGSKVNRWTEKEPGAHNGKLSDIYQSAKDKVADAEAQSKVLTDRAAKAGVEPSAFVKNKLAEFADTSARAREVLGAIRQVADGNEKLTDMLDAHDDAHPMQTLEGPFASRVAAEPPLPESQRQGDAIQAGGERSQFDQQHAVPGSTDFSQRSELPAEKPQPAAPPEPLTPEQQKARLEASRAADDARRAKEEASGVRFDKNDEADAPKDELNRQPADKGSVIESVERAKATPAYKSLFKAIGDMKKGRFTDKTLGKLQSLADTLSAKFGVSKLNVRAHGDDAKIPIGGVEQSGKTVRGFYHNGEKVISLNRGLKPHELVSTFLHEFGHHLQAELFHSAVVKPELRLAMHDAYTKWRAERVAKGGSVTDARATRAPFFSSMKTIEALQKMRSAGGDMSKMPDVKRDYLLDFGEFSADMTARALEQHGGVRDIIGGHFAKVAHALKMVYDMMRGHDSRFTDTPDAFHQFVRDTFQGDTSRAQTQTEEEMDNKTAERLAPAPDGPERPFGTPPGAGPGNTPAELSNLLRTDAERRRIMHAFTRVGVLKQVLAHAMKTMSPADFEKFEASAMDVGSQSTVLLNAGYKMWSEGKLNLNGEGLLATLRTWRENMAQVLGVKTNDRMATRAMSDAKEGKLGDATNYDARGRIEKEIQYGILHKAVAAERRGDMATAKVLRTELAARQATQRVSNLYNDSIKPLIEKMTVNADTRMRETQNPGLMKLVSLINPRTGERTDAQGYSSLMQRNDAAFHNRARKILNPLSKAEKTTLVNAMIKQRDITDPKLGAAQAQLRELLGEGPNGIAGFMRSSGVKFGHQGNYWPVVTDPTDVANRMGEYKAMLNDPRISDDSMRTYFHGLYKRAGMSPLDIDAKTAALTREDMVNSFTNMATYKADVSAGGHSFAGEDEMPIEPGGSQFHPRVSEFLYNLKDVAPDLIDKFATFQSKDIDEVTNAYLTRSVRKAVYTGKFIRSETKVNDQTGHTSVIRTNLIEKHLAEAKALGASDAHMQMANNYVDAALGRLGSKKNGLVQKTLEAIDTHYGSNLKETLPAKLRTLNQAVMAYQSVRNMALGAFGTTIDTLGAWTRSSSASVAFGGLRDAIKAAAAKDPTALRDSAEALGTVRVAGQRGAAESAFGTVGDNKNLFTKISHGMFRWNGQEAIANFARMMATGSAHRFLLSLADGEGPHTARYLSELGLKASDIKAHPTAADMVDYENNPKIQRALYQFVEESVIQPRPTQRPTWMSDPRFAVASQFKSFMYSFYDTIAGRIHHELKHGNTGVLVPAASYIAMTMATEAMKDFVQYGPGGNPNNANQSTQEYWQHIMDRTGIVLDPEEAMAAQSTGGQLGAYTNFFGGPTGDQITQLMRAGLGGGNSAVAVHDALPLHTITNPFGIGRSS